MKSKILILGLMLVALGLSTRAQQAPNNSSTNTSLTGTTPTETAASASIAGTISNARTGEPLRKASVSLRQSNGGRGNNNGGGRGGNNNNIGQALQNAPALTNGTLANAGVQGGNAGGQNGGGQNGRGGQQNNQAQALANLISRGPTQVTTGDDGTYSFPNVAPGQYQVVVDRDGFINQEYGQRSWVSGTGATLTVAAGQKLAGINVSMIPAGTIAGRLRDENGEPVAGIQVQALSYQYQNGSKTLVSARQVVTDDLGNYRLYWLTPGDYYVSAIPNNLGGRRGQPGPPIAQLAQAAGITNIAGLVGAATAVPAVDEAYAPTYFPGQIDPENASVVTLPAAQDMTGIDFQLRPIQMLTVSGKVTAVDVSTIPLTAAQQAAQQRQQGQQAQPNNNNGNNNGGRGNRGNNNNGNNNNNNGGRGNFNNNNNNANVNVILSRIGPSSNNGGNRGGRGGGGGGGGRGGPPGGFGGNNQSRAIVSADGTFQVSNVIPGTYNLIAVQQAAGQTFSARTKVEVGFANVTNINLIVVAGIDIKGQIVAEDKTPTNFKLSNVRVQLQPTEDLPVGNSQAQVAEDGTFTLTSVPAMSYKITVSGVTGGYVVGGRYQNNDVMSEPLQVEQGQAAAALTIQVGFQPGTVTGDVRDGKDMPFQAATCVLVPTARNRIDLYKTASSDQNGKFTFSNVAPGDYKLFAWESVPSGAYEDATYMRPFEDKGKPVIIGKGATIPTQISVIPATPQ